MRGAITITTGTPLPIRIALIAAAALALAGCQTIEERRTQIASEDDAACRSYGARPGSAVYVQCRTNLSQVRATEEAARRPVIVQRLGVEFGYGTPFCRRTAFGLRCW
jgi:hypothetical protein